MFQKGVLDPQGPIGAAERLILLNATTIMLAVIIPVIILTMAVAWWFRAGNTKAEYRPDWSYSGPVEVVVWSVPTLVVLFLGGITWLGTHQLDPLRPIASEKKALDVEVVSLDWKWLFIYPEQGIASVNALTVPAGTPIHFKLTSASVMNSFFVPQLGSQIYAMAGMTTQLNLMADTPGTFPGFSAQFSGEGFSDMRFDVTAVDQPAFDAWVEAARAETATLNTAGFADLSRPSVVKTPLAFSRIEPDLFDKIAQGDRQASAQPAAGHTTMDAH